MPRPRKSQPSPPIGTVEMEGVTFRADLLPRHLPKLMERILHGLHWKTLLLYFNDIIVIALVFDTHLHRLDEVFQRLPNARLKLKPSKCELPPPPVHYLGHIVNQDGFSQILLKDMWSRNGRTHMELRSFRDFPRQSVTNDSISQSSLR